MKNFCAFIIAICFVLNVKGQKTKVLFIGNSYTYVNNLPQTVADIALSKGDSLFFDSSTPGGYTLNGHSTDAVTLAKINSQAWNFVVLQEQSQLPSFDPTQVSIDVFPFAHQLDSMILANDSCTETVFYMTWGRQNGDLSNCASYPPVCTFDGMQQRLRESYLQIALDNHSSVSPVGVAWKHVRDSYPAINLYQADESHPSVYGTYLAACVFYSAFYHKTSVGSSFLLPGISTADALILQTIGSSTVLDSISLWQGNGDLPISDFNYVATGNVLQFNNTSANATDFTWNFGDGNFSTQINPQNIFSSVGQFIVSLTSSTSCFSYIHYDTININALGVRNLEKNALFDFYPNPVANEFNIGLNNIKYDHLKMKICNAIGQIVEEKEFEAVFELKGDVSKYSDGMYSVYLYSDGQLVYSQKMVIQK